MATVNVSVNEVNNAPIATAVAETTDEDAAAFSVDLLADGNTSDADSTDTLSITDVTQSSGRAVEFDITSGVFSFDPSQFNDLPQGAQEAVEFTYTVDDGRGLSNSTAMSTITITVDGINDTPAVDLDGSTEGTDFASQFMEAGGAVAIVGGDATVSPARWRERDFGRQYRRNIDRRRLYRGHRRVVADRCRYRGELSTGLAVGHLRQHRWRTGPFR